ncbi:MAG TPA: aldo/keto reductase [Vicinamibacterales bacterium]|nr:aldo/keto reductase [Vicinamibacterales bacterium]
MQTRQLGTSDLHFTTIGLGTWAMGGGGWKFGWGAQDDAASIRAIQAGIDAGINWIDTAAIYGHGHSEEIVGRAIAGRRNEVFVATKCGRVWEEGSRDIGKRLRRESVLAEADASLRRLGIDVIDLYQMHWPEPDEEVEEGWAAVNELIAQGKVRYGGVCNFSTSQLDRAQALYPITSLQPPYSMLRRDIEAELVPWCAKHHVGILAYSPMQAGLLTGAFTAERAAALPADDWRHGNPLFHEPQLSANLRVVERLRPIAARLGVGVAEVALAWVLRLPEMTSAIAGARSPEQIRQTALAGDLTLPTDALAEIDAILAEREAV